jgi:hypothetical protein
MAKKKGTVEQLAAGSMPPTAPPTAPAPVTAVADDFDRALTTPLPSEEESRLRKLQLENERLQLENEKLRFENMKVRNDAQRGWVEIWLRVSMAVALFLVVVGYIIWVLVFLGGQTGDVRLSDTVLGVLLGTTSVNVIGLLLTVARYLFPTTGKPALPDG